MGTDYHSLKASKQLHSKVFNNRSSSISAVRIEREFSPSKRKNSIESAVKAENLIRDLTLDYAEDEEKHRIEAVLNETLSGSCKSKVALNFRMVSDENNASFMKEVSCHGPS